MNLRSSSRSGAGHGTALVGPLLAMVTDRNRYRGGSDAAADEPSCAALVAAAAAAARAGVDFIQIRERGLDDVSLLELTERVCEAVAGSGARVLVNDRLDVALAGGAAGVHLPARAVSSARVRTMAPAGLLIGRSVHSEREARDAALEGGCDYLVFGSVFESASKPSGHPVAGLDALARVCASVPLPVLAIGGITAARVPDIVRAGAAGIAAIGLFATGGQRDLVETVTQVRSAFAVGQS